MPYSITDPASTEVASGSTLSLGVTGTASGMRLFVRIKSGGELAILEDYLAAITSTVAITNREFILDSPVSSIALNLPTFTASYGRSQPRTFTVEVFEIADTAPAPAADAAPIFVDTFTVTDDDSTAQDYGTRTRSTDTDANILGAATSENGTLAGDDGNDEYVITQYQTGALTISDSQGDNTVRFDYGTTITGFAETSVANGRLVRSVTLTLDTEATITMALPAGARFNKFQLGDGAVMFYTDFKTAIGATGTNTTSMMTTPYTVGGALTDSTAVTDESSIVRTISTTTINDVVGTATDSSVTLAGDDGDDVYVINRFQFGDVTISDSQGDNVVKFDYGVRFLQFQEVSVANGRLVRSVTLTLGTEATVTMALPAGARFNKFQLGDGEVMFYTDFRAAINGGSRPATNTPVTFANPYQVDFPAPEFLNGDIDFSVTEDTDLTEPGAANSIVIHDIANGASGLTFTAAHGNAATQAAITLGSPTALGSDLRVTTDYGTLTLSGVADSGDLTRATWSYTLTNGSELDSLGTGDEHFETIRIGISDDGGNTTVDTFDIDITINGMNETQVGDMRTVVRGTTGADTFDAAFMHGTPPAMRTATDAEILIGGPGEDIINTLGGNDAVFGGYGRDTINLDDNAAETVYIRFASNDNGFDLIDGGDTINSFERGVDKLVLVDMDNTPLDFMRFTGTEGAGTDANGIVVNLLIGGTGRFEGFSLEMDGTWTPAEGPTFIGNPAATPGGNRITINWDTSLDRTQFESAIGMYNRDNFSGDILENYTLFDELFGGTGYIDVVDDNTITAPLSFDLT